LVCFEQRFLANVPTFIGRTAARAALADEVVHQLRTKLLIAQEPARPAILSYRGEGPLGGWLRLVAVRAAYDQLRARGEEWSLEDEDTVASNMGDPELQYLKTRYADLVSEAFSTILAGLAADERNILNQYYADGLPSEVLARLYRVDPSTIRRRLSRLRDAILEETRRLLVTRHGIAPSEVDSLILLVRSQIDLSLTRHLRSRNESK
jgi:RNA polymerase sigma-70 factor (ECF subfamily)